MKTNSNYRYASFHPEYLIDLLRAGGRFPVWQTFSFPSGSDKNEIKDFIERKFPPISEERYEVWLRFRFDESISKTSLSLEDIESAHFYSNHRQEATSAGVLHTLTVYGIQIGDPLDKMIHPIIEEYTNKVREHVADTIVKAWFPKVAISDAFVEQLTIGYKYQQSPAPEKLPAIPSQMIWAHLVAYNSGLRKFEERPRVLLLQDIQEVLRRTDTEFKNGLKSIGDIYSSKFSDLVDQAEMFKGELSKWLLQNRSLTNTYLYDVEQYLNKSAGQQSFFYTSLLYLYWRSEVLNKDYNGKLSDKKDILLFLGNALNIGMEQAVAEALFTLVYAGGPRVFQKALIEARFRILNLTAPKIQEVEVIPPDEGKQLTAKPPMGRLFSILKKEFAKLFDRRYTGSTEEKKKEILKEVKVICGTKANMAKGVFNYSQYVKLCLLFGVSVGQFDDEPNNDDLASDKSTKTLTVNANRLDQKRELSQPEIEEKVENPDEAITVVETVIKGDENNLDDATNSETVPPVDRNTYEEKVEQIKPAAKKSRKSKLKIDFPASPIKQELSFPTQEEMEVAKDQILDTEKNSNEISHVKSNRLKED